MIPTTSVEWSDWPSPNRHLGHSLEKRGPSRQEGAAGTRSASQAEEESSMTKGGSK